nr:phosphotransferase [Rhodovulum sulfidophilum]
MVIVEREGTALDVDNSAHLTCLGKTLAALHYLPTKQFDSQLFANDLLKHGRYCEQRVWQALITPRLQRLFSQDASDYLFQALAFPSNLKNQQLSLIHGGLHDRNMLFFGGTLKLIDWSSARFDHPLIDVAQFILSSALTQTQATRLARAYAPKMSLVMLAPFIRLNMVWNMLHMPTHPTYRRSHEIWLAEYPNFRTALQQVGLVL